jgi:hypothetical protein
MKKTRVAMIGAGFISDMQAVWYWNYLCGKFFGRHRNKNSIALFCKS